MTSMTVKVISLKKVITMNAIKVMTCEKWCQLLSHLFIKFLVVQESGLIIEKALTRNSSTTIDLFIEEFLLVFR
jgi:hypothetical protein